jgi:CheY-like chemotaxis protein
MNTAKVMIVDDDEDICDFVSWGLSDHGYEVVAAENGKEAMESAPFFKPDAIILDMRMPVMDGWEFIKAYRELPGPHAPIIIMTAYMDPKQVAAEAGAQGYISKPFDLLTLVDLLRKHIPQSEI